MNFSGKEVAKEFLAWEDNIAGACIAQIDVNKL